MKQDLLYFFAKKKNHASSLVLSDQDIFASMDFQISWILQDKVKATILL